MFKRNFKDDYVFGINSENNSLPIINKFFDTTFKKLDHFNTFDFESDKILLEIKTRTCKSTDYLTTMIPYNKLKKSETITKDIYFIFIFRDKITYIKFCPTLFNTFEKKLFVRNRRNGINDKEQDYLFIPINKLKSINYDE